MQIKGTLYLWDMDLFMVPQVAGSISGILTAVTFEGLFFATVHH